jgi:hypothetical protein
MPNLEITGRIVGTNKITRRIPLNPEARSALLGRLNASPEDLAAGVRVTYAELTAAGIVFPEHLGQGPQHEYSLANEDEG